MGTIRIGRKEQVSFVPDKVQSESRQLPSETMSEEQKSNLIESIKQMPKEKWVAALRGVGLEDEANECERQLAEEHLQEMSRENTVADVVDDVPAVEYTVENAEGMAGSVEITDTTVVTDVTEEKADIEPSVEKPKRTRRKSAKGKADKK